MDRTVHMPWEVTAGGKSYTLPPGYRVKVRDSQPWHETVILEFLWPPGTDFDDTIWAPVLATDVDRYTDVIMTPMDPAKRIVRGVWGVACTDGETRVLPNKYKVTVDRWMPEINAAQINVLQPSLDGIQVRITACVGVEDLALHTYPAPPPEG